MEMLLAILLWIGCISAPNTYTQSTIDTYATAKLRASAEPDDMGQINPKGALTYPANMWGGKDVVAKTLYKQWTMENANYRVKCTIKLIRR